jgi:GT2 family glycosyltransferase/predicted SAM-dependent methyltransferase
MDSRKVQIQQLISNNQWEQAKTMLQPYHSGLAGFTYDDEIAIFDASICMNLGDMESAMDCIRKGLSYNIGNYELYFMMGNIFEAGQELDRAYLCYEKAIFQCTNEDIAFLEQYKNEFVEKVETLPGKVAIVILTFNNLEYTQACLKSIRLYNDKDTYELIIVDNHSTDGTVEWLLSQPDLKLILNDENKGFPAGCNQGIELAEKDSDILLLNNDTIVMENSIFSLRMGLYSDQKVGATGSSSNKIGYYQKINESFQTLSEYESYAYRNNIPDASRYERRMVLIGFALLLKRGPLNEIGYLDERFTPGNYEDNDICMRLILQKYHLLLCRDSFIFHFGSKSFSLDTESYSKILLTNRMKYFDKWGINAHYFSEIRFEVTQMIQSNKDAAINVLEVGCACGATLLQLASEFRNATCYGIELNPTAATVAACSFEVKQGDVETMELDYQTNYFDYIIFADVLEHLEDPGKTMSRMKRFLKKDGHILVSVPNIMYFDVLLPLLKGRFTYTEKGPMDKASKRSYTIYDMLDLIKSCGFTIEAVNSKNAPANEEDNKMIDQLCAIDGVCGKEFFLTYQYLISATSNS